MTRLVWKSDCCRAALDSYKETECPVCGRECEAEPPEPPEIMITETCVYTPPTPASSRRTPE